MNRKKRISMRQDDSSGTPMALLELVRANKALGVVDSVDESNVAVDFPFGLVPKRQTGCSRFVKLVVPIKRGRASYRYVLVDDPNRKADLPQFGETISNDEKALNQRLLREEKKK